MLTKRGVAPTVLEADRVVGGISRTVERDGWRFDIGGHRFFTKVKPVDDLWFEILGADEFLRAPADEPHLLPGQALRLPDQADERAAEPRPGRGGALRGLVRRGRRSARRRTRQPRGLHRRQLRLAALPATSSRPTTRRSGACRPSEIVGRLRRAAHQGHVALARAVVGADPGQGRSAAATSRSRSRASSRSSTTRSTARARCGRSAAELVDRRRHQGRRSTPRSRRSRHARRRAPSRSTAETRRRADARTSAPTSSRRCRSARCSRRWTRRCRPRCSQAADGARATATS